MSRYMNRFYGLSKDATQKLLDLAVEDNLVKLENKIGTKGTKSGVEEKAYRWPTLDMLPRYKILAGFLFENSIYCCSTSWLFVLWLFKIVQLLF